MSIGTDKELVGPLELPDEFEDLTGMLQADLRVIVTALTQRAAERSLVSRRQARQFQRDLWNELTHSINRAVQSLDPNRP
jgi:hypothetical protein